jgi:hypothetical protein
MSDIVLIACPKSKRDQASPAGLLYRSPLFAKSLLYALTRTNRIYIIPAKHGVLRLTDFVEPYDLSIKGLSISQKLEWGIRVGENLRQFIKSSDQVHILTGSEYVRPLLPVFQQIGCKVILPLADKSLGQRISWLRRENREEELTSQFSEFYNSMRSLYVGQHGGRLLSECAGKMIWPPRGIYFLLEPNENLLARKFRPLHQRVTRVGTHGVSRGSKATLWNRISAHRGVTGGGGNHRSSIFRLHVGAALIRRFPETWSSATWGIGQTAEAPIQETEKPLEEYVSRTLGQMRVLWLDVPDDPGPHSDRAYLERNSIGLLSRSAILQRPQSPGWLGNWSKQLDITLSALWNLDHLYRVPDKDFTAILAKYVDITLGKTEAPGKSLAPVAWYVKRQSADSPQLLLFADDPAKPPT